ncbi:hypothetical protein BZA77DRAFT_353189 [Pyronema omphalodes]|nr:hypothetical protein BZA77DRAFT_353189 [Pyronema omphalodes]
MLDDLNTIAEVFKVISGNIHDTLVPNPEPILDSSADHMNEPSTSEPLNVVPSRPRDKHLEASIRTVLEELYFDSEYPEKHEQVELVSITKTNTRFSFTVKVHQSQVQDCTHDILYLIRDAGWWKEVKQVFEKGGFEEQTQRSVENGHCLLTWSTGKLNTEEETLYSHIR